MKQAEVAKILSKEFGTTDINELNKLFKAKNAPQTKYRFGGKKLGHGVTGPIKAITETGVKVIGNTRVTLVLFSDIETLDKPKPRSERPVYPKAPSLDTVKKALADDEDEDDDDLDDDDEDFEIPKPAKPRKRAVKPVGKSGSKFIPREKKKN
ncbi:hypothetical protein [Bdellovibrio sp. HCB337]|uniref:hypothetical protein n=1 Tax=Bdellovibrio sp. HCB337 TaxID=3394358 RepID=UPI0039A60AB2